MDDLQRELEETIAQADRTYTSQGAPAEEWNVLLVGSRGRMMRFGRFKRLVMAVAGLLLLLAGLSALLGGLYYQERNKREAVSQEKSALLKELANRKKTNEVLMARLATLELVTGVDTKPVPRKVTVPEKHKMVKDKPPAEPAPARPVVEKKPAAPVPPVLQKVTVDRFRIRTTQKHHQVIFNIRNMMDKGPVSGHIFSVLTPKNAKVSAVSAPAASIRNGKPADAKKGQFFSINRFKEVQLHFPASLDMEQFAENRIFVFDVKGNLMLDQRFPTGDSSQYE